MAASGDTLGVGISGLLAFQRALATTSHNVANAATPGYSRQRVELAENPPQQIGEVYLGTGVNVMGVQRIADQFLTGQVRTATSSASELTRYQELASQVDNLFSDPIAALTPSLQSFFNAVQGVANDPASGSAREVMLSAGRALVERFRYLQRSLEDMRSGVNTTVAAGVNDINALAGSIADINKEIVRARGSAGGPPNDLLDQRDALVARLAEQVSVTTVEQDDGALNVFIGNGHALVAGNRAMPLATTANPFDATRLEISDGANVSGGVVGGALRFRSEILDVAQNALGRIATGLGLTFNAQHAEGMDLTGALGGAFFGVGTPQVLNSALNAGAGSVTATISDAAALTGSDYRVTFAGAGTWNVERVADGTVTTGAGPFNVDGLTLTVGGAPTVGDSFLVQPTRQGAATLSVAITDPRRIAAAAPIHTGSSAANTGTAVISPGEVLDATNPALLNTVTLNFVSATQYQVNGAGPLLNYTSGANIDLNGWRVQVSGTAQTGDTFTIQANTNGVSDNRNALALAELQSQPTLGGTNYTDALAQAATQVGAATRSAGITLSAQQNLLQQVTEARDAVSGVNLDEEASNMLRWQQAYQAAAKVIGAADTLFQSLLAAVRG